MKTIALFIVVAVVLFIGALQLFWRRKQRRIHAKVETDAADGVYIFTSKACGACTQLKRSLGSLTGTAGLNFVDVDERLDLTTRYQIRSVPTTLVVRHGHVVESVYGRLQLDQVRAWLGFSGHH